MAIQVSLPEKWEVARFDVTSDDRIIVGLNRSDLPSATPLIVVDDRREYIQQAIDQKIKEWNEENSE